MAILVTGGSGFIGSHLVRRLASEGTDLVLLGRKPTENDLPSVNSVCVDLSTGDGLESVPWSSIDKVVHLAAAGVKPGAREWADCVSSNIVGTYRLLQAVHQHCPQCPTVFIGATYYERAHRLSEGLHQNSYVITKAASSELARLWSTTYAGAVVIGTIFHVYGPGDNAKSVLSYAMTQLREGRTAYLGAGTADQDWLYIDDAVAAIVELMQLRTPGLSEFDIGSGIPTQLRVIIDTLRACLGRPIDSCVYDSSRDRANVPNGLLARRLPERWTPRIRLDEGVRRMLQNTMA